MFFAQKRYIYNIQQIGINHDEDDDKDIFETEVVVDTPLVRLLEFWPLFWPFNWPFGQFWPTAPPDAPQLEQQ